MLEPTIEQYREDVARFEREVRQEERRPAIRGDQRMAYLMRERLAAMRKRLAEMEARHAGH